jgi:MFS family permease
VAHIRLPDFTHLHIRAERRTDGVHALYANIFLRSLAIYTFGLFVPLYLLKIAKNSYGANLFEALAFTAIYYLAIRIVYIFLYLPLVKVIQAVGTRWSIFISNIFLIIFLWSLNFAQVRQEFLLVSIVSVAIYAPLYWTSFRYLLASDSHKDKRGREVGKVGIMDRLGQIIGPLLGGIIIAQFGFGALFAFSVVLVLFSSIPPFFMRYHSHDGDFKLLHIIELIADKKNRGVLASIGSSAIRDTTDAIFWPIFAFFIVSGYDRLGIFFSLTALITLGIIWVVGFVYDKAA